MIEFNCHSGTSKKEILDFITPYFGSKIRLHFEHNVYHNWGDDDDIEFEFTEENREDITSFIERHYIHNVYIL
jgi:hypothetical protein